MNLLPVYGFLVYLIKQSVKFIYLMAGVCMLPFSQLISLCVWVCKCVHVLLLWKHMNNLLICYDYDYHVVTCKCIAIVPDQSDLKAVRARMFNNITFQLY